MAHENPTMTIPFWVAELADFAHSKTKSALGCWASGSRPQQRI